MSNLMLILLCLGIALVLFVYLTERFAAPMPPEKLAKISQWIWPLVGLMIVIQLFRYTT